MMNDRPDSPFDDSAQERQRRMGLVLEDGKPDKDAVAVLSCVYAGQYFDDLCDFCQDIQSVRESVAEVYGGAFHVFERPIEQTIKVAECPAAGMSILEYAPKDPAAESYRSLAREVLRFG